MCLVRGSRPSTSTATSLVAAMGTSGRLGPGRTVAFGLTLLALFLTAAPSSTVATKESSSSSAAAAAGGSSSAARCEEITIPMCRGIGYNLTFMPNQFNHETQEEAGLEVHQFWPLVEIQCSSDLKFFLCSMYAPICIEDYHQPLPACRTVCERARAGCAPLMLHYGFAWPEQMNCDKLPDYGDSQKLCMDSKNGTEAEKATPPYPKYKAALDRGRHPYRRKGSNGGSGSGRGAHAASPAASPPAAAIPASPKGDEGGECACRCRAPFLQLGDGSPYYNRVATGGELNCATPCSWPPTSDTRQSFTTLWIGLWSVLCCVSTTMTLSTFLIDMQRFKYPERPIIFLSGCYAMVSVGYIVPLVLGPANVACDGPTMRYDSSGPAACTAVFLLVYFFGMASSIWWVILAFTWFLAAGLKWGNEAIASYSQYFHLAAWLIPSVKSIAILATSSVDGDGVTGICYVGNHDVDDLRGFVLVPLFVYLLLGTSFLLAGFVSLFRIRNVIKQQGRNKTEKLEKLMMRIGIFSVLYTVPAVIILVCYFYEQHLRPVWQRAVNCPCEPPATPEYSIFMLKYFMCLGVGITSGAWIWSGKTLDSWRRFYANLCRRSGGGGGGSAAAAAAVALPPADGRDGRTVKQASVHSVNHVHLHKQVPLSHV